MRIPNKLKEDKELIQLNLLNVALQNNNYADFFKNIKYEWSERVKAPVEDLLSMLTFKSLLKSSKKYIHFPSQTTRGAVQADGQRLCVHLPAQRPGIVPNVGGGAEERLCCLKLD